MLFFPISYIFGDILTEVYGYARARRVDLGRIRRARVCLGHGVGRGAPAAGGSDFMAKHQPASKPCSATAGASRSAR